MRVPLELRRAYKLLNHGPTTLVTSAAQGRTNVMAAAWGMPLDFEPPKVAVVLAESTFTRELVDASGELTLCVPTRAQLEQVYAVGSESGRDEDKWARYGLKPVPASRVQAPLVEGCVGWLECRVLPEPEVQRKYDLFVVEVVAAWWRTRCGRTEAGTSPRTRCAPCTTWPAACSSPPASACRRESPRRHGDAQPWRSVSES
ncbi:MAG TPA: flavin reductase family protein [Myxococcaceae bacterium]|nr:flavin reductase family protein [Myxococcaceae bacterium]